MARGAGEAAAEGELGDDSLSVITCESDTAVKLKKKIFHKPPKSPRMSHALKSDVDMGHMRANVSSSTPEYLKEALGMKKPKHSRSSRNGYIPGTPDYKEKEDMYDEIIELKKTIQAQKNEGDRMKTKLRRLEEENNRKDKQIEQLLDPSRGSELARALSEKETDNGWVVTGLKQKIVKLEEQCKEKDNVINEFQADVKTSNLEEVRLAMETYYEQVHRLQLLLAKSETMRKKLDIKQLLQAKAEVELELQKWQNKMEQKSTEEQALSEEIQNLTQKVGKLELKLEEEKRQMAEDTVEKPNKAPPACTVTGKENRRKERAAKIIQRYWKRYKTKAVAVLQAAFRGHISRQKVLLDLGVPDAESPTEESCLSSMSDSSSFSSDCKERDEIVTFIQSIFRAHLTRTGLLQDRCLHSGESPSRWEEKSSGKIPGSMALLGEHRLESSDVRGRMESSPGFVISFDYEQKITEEGLAGEEG
ncbi:hypothetical protein DUI87_05314 [Hirundo rustica rustica]|uniref:IQ domain-containing protein E n=1 Tax=Hirundo rustica rustica TaxID=333673 RepID=A0A3M0L3V9_HIRRU|nr:hypothetical protein DUI87_05314 [Hirundo rustica rustica]